MNGGQDRSSFVSVLMPVYNAERTVAAAMRSVLRQSWQAMELVVVNDGSTDGTASILAQQARSDPRVRIVERANGGIVAALNEGWQACRGDYVARMDADDLCLPWRLSSQVDYMKRHPDIAAAGTAILPFESQMPFVGLPASFPGDDAGVRTRLLFNPPIMHPTAIFRRQALGDPPPYTTAMPQAEDYELWTRLAPTHRLGNIDRICLLYRRSAGSISSLRRDEQLRQAGELRLRNLARVLGDAFARDHAELHLELMRRAHAPGTLLAQLPAYVTTLLDTPALSRHVLERVWFSYCAAYARSGRDGAALFQRVTVRQRALHPAAVRLLGMLR